MEKPTRAAITTYTPNQVVAANLYRARLEKGWTQAEAAERIAPHLGVHWSAASYSLCERSVERTDRIRNFTADELVAFSQAFSLPVLWFFLPPNLSAENELRIAPKEVAEEEALTAGPYLEALFGAPTGPGVLAERLEELQEDHPEEIEARHFALLRQISQLASLSAIKKTVEGIRKRSQALKDVATMLDEAAGQTEGQMAEALNRALIEYHEEGASVAPTTPRHARPR